MKWLPHIHRLQLHPHGEEVASQISMVLGKEQGGGTGSVSAPSTKEGPILLEIYLKCLCVGFVTQLITRLPAPPTPAGCSWSTCGWKQPKMALIHPGGCLAPAGHQIQTCAGFHVP